MASTINASSSGSGGLISTGDASGVLQLQNNGTAAVTVTGGNTGFGTASPTSVIQATASSAQIITMERSGVRTWAHNVYGDGHYSLVDVTGSVERLVVNTNSNVILAGGTQSASGIGITFPSAQSASSDANCLDDYEEGTWTYTVYRVGGSFTGTGYYTKVGRLVHAFASISYDGATGTSNSLQSISLPFTTASSGNAAPATAGLMYNMYSTNGSTIYPGFIAPAGSNVINLYLSQYNTTEGYLRFNGSGAYFSFNIVFITA